MNMMTPEKFIDLQEDATATESPALKRMMKQWEKKLSKNAKRAGGFGMVAITLAACGGSSSTGGSDNDNDNGDATTPVPEGGVWSLVAGGLQLAGNFDPAIFAGGALPAGVLTGDPSVLTPTEKQWVQGEGLPSDGDDLVLTTSGAFTGAVINLGGGEDTIFIDVTGATIAGLVTNVEIIELSNGAVTGGGNVVNLSTVLDVEKVVISETSVASSNLQVTNIRNTAEVEVQGNFNNNVFIDFLNATGPLSLTLNDYFQNAGSLNIAQDFSAINITSAGEGSLNAIDSGALGANLQSLNIDGTVDFEVIGGAIAFRPNTQAKIDASDFEGENLTLTVGAHRDVMFTGSDANDSLSVTTAQAAVGPDQLVKLTADFGAGDNTLIVNGGGFVTPASSIVSDGDLTLIVGPFSNIDMSQPDANGDILDLSAVTSVIIGQGSTLNLTAEQVAQVGIENFKTPDFGNVTGALNIVGVDGEPLDLSDIDVGTVVNLTTVPGDVVFSSETVLGNANAGVSAIIVDNRGTDSTVTMSGIQFQQMAGTGTVSALGGAGTNNPATGMPYTTGLVLTDLDPDTAYNLNGVTTDTTDIQLTDFTAGSDFAITNTAGTELTLTLVGDVDLTGAATPDADIVVFADGLVLTAEAINATSANLDQLVIEGTATINVGLDVTLDTSIIVGDASQVVINFEGSGAATLDISGPNDITLKAVNAGDDITSITITNNLDAGATLDIAGGSPAMILGEDATMLMVSGDVGTTTLIGTDADQPGIVSSTLTTINTDPDTDAVINLGVLSVTSSTLEVTQTAGDGTTSVEIAEVPAGAAWEFTGVELVINDVSGFGAGATIKLGAGTTLSGDASIADIAPFLTSDSIVPLDATSTAAEIDTVLQGLQANQATINVTGMDQDQLEAIIDNSLKVDTINGDLVLNADLSVFQINTLSGLYDQGMDDILTIDADGMSTAQKAASANAVAANTTVVNLTLDSDDTVFVIGELLPLTANNSTVVEADGMAAVQLNALVDDMPKVQVINDMTLTAGNDDDQITALLSKAAPESVTVDAAGMDDDQFAAIVQQITKIEVVENLTVMAGSPDEDFQFTALLELAVDAEVDAANMSDARLSIVAENIDNIADDGITNLTVTATQTPEEIEALMSKAPDGSVLVDLSDMDADQVAAVVDAADKVLGLTVGENSSVTLTLAEFNALEAAGLAPIIGEAASGADDTGGSITIVAEADGTLDLALVEAGASGPGTAGTLTLQIEDGVSLSVEGATGSEVLSVTGMGTLVVTENLNLSGLDLSVEGGITIELAPDVTLTLIAAQASALAEDGVTIEKAAATAPAVEGQITALGGINPDAGEPQDLSGLDLSLVDVLILQDFDRTILPSSAAALPAQVGVAFIPEVSVPEDTDWSAYEGLFNADMFVAPNATVILSAASASQITDTGSWVIGQDATADGETGGSIAITALENGEEYNLSGTFNPGDDGGFAADAGTFVVSISSDVTLEPGTILPTAADIIIDAGAALTVNGGTAQADGTYNYEGLGTLNFVDLDGNTVTATDDVRFNTFTFEDADTDVIINGFEAINVGGFNGRFLFDDSGAVDVLGTMSLDLSAFDTTGNGVDVVTVANLLTVDYGDSGVIVIPDGVFATIDGADYSGVANAQGAEVFFAVNNGADTDIFYWADDGTGGGTANDGIVDTDELTLIATLTDTGADQLGSENFTL